MAQNDYAILVGISRYADRMLHPLDGPVRDVGLIYNWLVSPRYCAVPPDNIRRIVSDESVQLPGPDRELPPVLQDFLDIFLGIVLKPDRSGYHYRADGRLYLYLSGHGFCEKSKREAHAALYVANADRYVPWNIYGSWFAWWAKDQGLFGEIVLIMDCCRDAELAKQPVVPPLLKPLDVGTGRDSRLFELYAAPRGGKAQERPIPSRDNEIHGLLTWAFLDAIEHAEPGKTEVPTGALKDYLEQRWSDICGEVPADPPEIVPPSNGEIVFKRTGSADLVQRFKLNALSAGGSFKIIGPSLAEVAQVTLDAEQASVAWADGRIEHVAIRDRAIDIPFPATFYLAVAATPGGIIDRNFQAGGPDVEL